MVMKKITKLYSNWLSPSLLLVSLIPVMMYQSGGNFISQGVTSCILWILVLWRARTPSLYFTLGKDKAFICLALFIFWALINSLLWSTAKAISLFSVFTFFSGLLSYFIGYTSSKKQAHNFYYLLIIMGVMLSFYTYYQSFVLKIDRPSGMLGNWNTHAALLAIIILPTMLRQALSAHQNARKISITLIALLIFVIAIGLTLSRGVLLIFATTLSLTIIVSWRQNNRFKQGIFFLIVLVLGYVLQGIFSGESILNRLTINTNSVTSMLMSLGSGRHFLWQPAWQMFLDRPIFGWGLGVFYLIFPQYKAPLTRDYGFFAHNDYLQILVELGPLGLFLLIGFIAILTKRLYQLITTQEAFSANKLEAFTLLATCIGLLIHTFFTFHLYQITIQIILGFYLGRAAKLLHTEYHIIPNIPVISPSNQVFKKIYLGFACLIGLITTVLGISYYNLYKATTAESLPQSLKYYHNAGRFLPLLNRYEFFTAVELLQKIQNTKSPIKRNELKTLALQNIDKAISKMEIDAQVLSLKYANFMNRH